MNASLPLSKMMEAELLPTRPSLLAKLRNHEDSGSWHRGWEEFYLLYHPVIYRHAVNYGFNETEAEDVVQEIVVGLARNIPKFRYDPEQCSFKTWLFQVVRNKIGDHLRKRGRQRRNPAEGFVTDCKPEMLVEVIDGTILTPDREWDLLWEANLRRAALDQVKNRVKPITMRLFLHHVIDGYSVEETVDYFKDSHVSAEAVHLAKHRVQRMLDETVELLRNRTH